jgi:peptidase family C25
MIEIYGANSSYVHYTQEIFHCFGDPSMRIYTEVPTPFSGVKVSREGDRIRVVANEFATISFYDPKTNTVASYKGTYATFKTERTQDFIISVSRHNKIPYLDYGDIFIQNEKIKEDRTYNGNVVKIGSRVTTSKPFGDVVFETGTITISGKRIEIYPKTTFKKESRVTLTIK